MSAHASTAPASGAGSGGGPPNFSQLNNNNHSGGWSNNSAMALNRSSHTQSSDGPPPAYLMPTSPPKGRRGSTDGYRPTVKKSVGQIPSCLVNASVTYCGNDQIYAFGGFDQDTDEVYNHVLRLDLSTLLWTLVDNYGDIPGVRMGHTASLYQGDKLIVFGGENEHREHLSDVITFDIKTAMWTLPEVRGPIPRGRARHAAVIYEDKLFIVGGVTGKTNTILDDICYLDLKTWTWSRCWTFVARFDHAAWVWGGRLWVFGGLGMDMQRGTDLWWLDLKGTPSFGRTTSPTQGTVGPPGIVDRIAHNPGLSFSPHNAVGRPHVYAPSSANIQVRTLSRRNPIAPGAISSLKFHSGPHVPALLSGTHFHVYSSGVLLDLVTPSETVRPWDCNLSSMELDSLRWQKLADGPEIFQSGYRWHYCTINQDGTKAWLLGSNLHTPDTLGMGDDNNLSEVLVLDLEKYGLLGNQASEQNRILASERQTTNQLTGLGAELATVFDTSPESGSGTDFTITAEMDDRYNNEASSSPRRSNESSPQQGLLAFLPSTIATSDPIHVHRIILQTRWPHFRRLYAAKMAEYQTNRLHIPEPYHVVRAFLYYLYTDSISADSEAAPSVIDVAGMLVMANLYDMPKLRLLCVNRLSRELDVDNAAIVWERAVRTNEDWLKRRAASFCLANWGRIVRTDGFRTLSKQGLVELCEVVDMEARIVPGHDSELVDSYPGDRLGDKPPRMPMTGVSYEDDLDADDDEGMELS
ncbi:hypothetical protein FQN57_004727 [Myotisia sp. PD_48]|nr:hypothetical protein FQN57_004727 [Myotisia sp. PD_48]